MTEVDRLLNTPRTQEEAFIAPLTMVVPCIICRHLYSDVSSTFRWIKCVAGCRVILCVLCSEWKFVELCRCIGAVSKIDELVFMKSAIAALKGQWPFLRFLAV